MSGTHKILNRAADLAASRVHHNKHFLLGAVALREDGVFVYSTNEVAKENRTPSAHAEARVLRKAGRGAILWVARVLRGDKETWAQASPCSNCRRLILNHKVKKVYYTIGPDEFGVWEP